MYIIVGMRLLEELNRCNYVYEGLSGEKCGCVQVTLSCHRCKELSVRRIIR